MKKTISFFAALAIAATSYSQGNWVFDKSHSNITFTVKHMVIAEVSGSFKDSDVKVTSTTADFDGATIEFSAKVASIDTQNESRDGHLKGDDFFNAEKYPEIRFSGKLVKKGKTYSAVGKLTVRDITKDVTFPVEYLGTIKETKFTKAGFKLSGSINRFDYNLKWNKALESGGMVVGEEVKLAANIELNLSK